MENYTACDTLSGMRRSLKATGGVAILTSDTQNVVESNQTAANGGDNAWEIEAEWCPKKRAK